MIHTMHPLAAQYNAVVKVYLDVCETDILRARVLALETENADLKACVAGLRDQMKKMAEDFAAKEARWERELAALKALWDGHTCNAGLAKLS